VITKLLKQEKGRASCPASCNPQETMLNGTVSTNRPGGIKNSDYEISSIEANQFVVVNR
jgi:hypothetical protein